MVSVTVFSVVVPTLFLLLFTGVKFSKVSSSMEIFIFTNAKIFDYTRFAGLLGSENGYLADLFYSVQRNSTGHLSSETVFNFLDSHWEVRLEPVYRLVAGVVYLAYFNLVPLSVRLKVFSNYLDHPLQYLRLILF